MSNEGRKKVGRYNVKVGDKESGKPGQLNDIAVTSAMEETGAL